MAFRRHARTAGFFRDERHFRQECLDEHRVGDHADIRAETDQGDLPDRIFFIFRVKIFAEHAASEGRLIYDDCIFSICGKLRNDLPAVCPQNAVLYRKILSFLRLQIIFRMGVAGKDHFLTCIKRLLDPLLYRGNDGLSFLRAQRAVYKVRLHIYNDQIVLHGINLRKKAKKDCRKHKRSPFRK